MYLWLLNIKYGINEKQKDEENNPDKVIRGKEGRKTATLNVINEQAKCKENVLKL